MEEVEIPNNTDILDLKIESNTISGFDRKFLMTEEEFGESWSSYSIEYIN